MRKEATEKYALQHGFKGCATALLIKVEFVPINWIPLSLSWKNGEWKVEREGGRGEAIAVFHINPEFCASPKINEHLKQATRPCLKRS